MVKNLPNERIRKRNSIKRVEVKEWNGMEWIGGTYGIFSNRIRLHEINMKFYCRSVIYFLQF